MTLAQDNAMIRTVLGDIPANRLGVTNYHEHLFQITPLLAGDELDDETLSTHEAASLKRSGFAAMVDATPIGLERRPAETARISKSTGLQVIATTGRHREAHYAPDHWIRDWDTEKLTRVFITELMEGMPPRDNPSIAERNRESALLDDGAPIRAGILKAGIDYWHISSFERRTLDAVGAASAATGVAVMVHLEFCTAAHEVLDILEIAGCPPNRVVLAHADRNIDPGLHISLAMRGAYLGYDGFARPRTHSDAALLELTAAVVEAGGHNRIIVGGDVARRSRYVSYGGMPGLAYLGERYVPRLRQRIGNDIVEHILTENPARLLSLTR